MMKKKIGVLLLMVATAMSIAAYELNGVTVRYSPNGTIRSFEFSKTDRDADIPKSASDFFTNVLKKNINDDFKPNTSIKLDRGHEAYNQYYKGIPVEGAGYNFHFDDSGDLCFAHGNYECINDLNIRPSIKAEEAMNRFANYERIPVSEISDYTAELIVFMLEGENAKSLKTPYLAYKIYLNSRHPNNNHYGIIDAQTGVLLHREPLGICTTSTGTFEMTYQSSNKTAQTDYTSGKYRLYDNSRNTIIHTRDLANSAWSYYSSASEIYDSDNVWHTSELSGNQSMALDIHWGLQKIYDRLYNAHGKNSYDNNGKTINAYVRAHMQSGDVWTYDNAQFYYNNNDPLLFFGKGESVFKPLAALDVVSHEFGHGITSYQIGWSSSQRFLNEGLRITQGRFFCDVVCIAYL